MPATAWLWTAACATVCHRQAGVPPWKEGDDALESPCWVRGCLAVLSTVSLLTFGLAWVPAGADPLVQVKLQDNLLPTTETLARGGWGSPWSSAFNSPRMELGSHCCN